MVWPDEPQGFADPEALQDIVEEPEVRIVQPQPEDAACDDRQDGGKIEDGPVDPASPDLLVEEHGKDEGVEDRQRDIEDDEIRGDRRVSRGRTGPW